MSTQSPPPRAVYSNATRNLSGPGFSNGYHSIGVVSRLFFVVGIQSRVAEPSFGIQPRPNCTFNTYKVDKEIEGGNGPDSLGVENTIMHIVETFVILVIFKEILECSFAAGGRHTGFVQALFAKIRRAQTDFLPVKLVRSAEPLLLHLWPEDDDTKCLALLLVQFQHADTILPRETKATLAVPRPCDTLVGPILPPAIAYTGDTVYRPSAHYTPSTTGFVQFLSVLQHTSKGLPRSTVVGREVVGAY